MGSATQLLRGQGIQDQRMGHAVPALGITSAVAGRGTVQPGTDLPRHRLSQTEMVHNGLNIRFLQ